MDRLVLLNRFRQPGRKTSSIDRTTATSTCCLAATVLALAACYPGPVDPVGIPQAPAPYVRAPYVQQVTDSSAWVLWMSQPGSVDTAWFRVPDADSAWKRAEVEDHRYGTRKAMLGPLPVSTTVQYVVSAAGTRMGPHEFRTGPAAGTSGEDVRVLLFGDSGWGGPEQIDLARQMRRLDWDLSIHVGDIAYNEGAEDEFTERHFRVYARTLAATPIYPAVGNHDVRADGGRSYDGAFLWPEPFPGARYYSFRQGRVLFVSIDTSSKAEEVDGLRSGEGRQLTWLVETLREASVDSTVDWIVTFMHHPLYSHAGGISGHGLDRNLGNELLPLFERYGVDLVTAGHDHHYERTHPVRDGRRVEPGCGPVHVLSGGGGGSLYARDVTTSPLAATTRRVYEFVELTISRNSIKGRTIGRQGELIDEFMVRRYTGTDTGLPDRCDE